MPYSPPLFLLLLSTLLATAPSQAEPRFFEAQYVVHANGFKVGEMSRALLPGKDGGQRFETHMITTGLLALFNKDEIHMHSEWRETEGELQPLGYQASYTGRKKDREEILDFDWEHQLAVSRYKGETRKIKLDQPLYDKLLYQSVLKRDLARGAQQMEYRVIDRGLVKTYRFEVQGRERMVTELGELDTIKVSRGSTTFWCAVELDYLMVKIEQSKDDYNLTSYITSASFKNAAKPAATENPILSGE